LQDRPPLHLVRKQAALRLEEQADDDLMLLSRAGRQDAFEALVQRHQRLVLGLTTRFFGDAGAGRDVAQDVFLAIWAGRERYRAQGQFRSYLVSVALNRCRHVARGSKRHAEKLADLARDGGQEADPRALPLPALIERERRQEVRQALTQLPERCREVMILRFTHSMSLDEIAAATGMPPGTVKSHLSRGIKRLRRALGRG